MKKEDEGKNVTAEEKTKNKMDDGKETKKEKKQEEKEENEKNNEGTNNEEENEENGEEKNKHEEREEIKEEVKEAIEKVTKKQSKFLKEFREFALQGNAFDLAVGVLIGGAFQNIVTSLTNNIISPILGLFGGVNFSDHVLKIGKLNLTYGAFITDVINFIIMALVIFLLMKFVNKLSHLGHKKEEKVEPTTKICPHCYSEINIKADRCPYCTSEIEIKDEEK